MLEHLRRTLRWRWPLVLAIVLPAAFIGTAAVADEPASTDVVAVVGVSPERADTVSTDLVALTVGRYAVELTSIATLDRVGEVTGEDPAVLQDAVTAAVSADAGTLTIGVGLPSERDAVMVASALTQEAVGLGDDDIFMDTQVLADPRVEAPSLLTSPRVLEVVLVLAALLIAVAIAYVLEVTRPRIRSGGDAAAAAGGPVLGSLPPFVGPWPRRAVVDDGEVLKAARALRTGLASSAGDVPVGATCLVGAEQGAGATTVAFLIARTMADRGESTVLLDLDLDRAGLSRKLDLPKDRGLGDVLADRATLREAVHQEGAVAIVGTTPDPEADDDLDRRLPDVLKQAGDEWTLVLVDTGPVRAGEISEVVVAQTTSVIIVARLGSRRCHVERTAQRLERLGVPVRGVVLNHAHRADAEAVAAPSPSGADDA